jgi:hypothetical protein
MKKQLYFNFYVNRKQFPLDSIVNNIHFACLEYYKDIFDEVFINISLDDTEDYELIRDVQNKFLDIFGVAKRIVFLVNKNDFQLCESLFFYEEIYKKLNNLDLVFFAHNKGITNITDMDKDILFHWIIALYYGSLHNETQATGNLTRSVSLTYGSCYVSIKDVCKFYSGSFYWLNGKRIHQHLVDKGNYVPKLSSRYFVEMFPYYLDLFKHNNMDCLNSCCLFFEEADSNWWYQHAKEYCEDLGYLTDEFYTLYNYAIKEEYFI